MAEKNKKEIFVEELNRFLIDYFSWINIFIVLIVFLLGLWFFIIPKYQDVFSKAVSLREEAEKNYSEKINNLADIEELISAYNSVSNKNKEKIYSMLPDKAGEEELIRDMENIARSSGLILESVRAESVAEDSSINENYFVQQQKDEDEKILPQGVGAVEIEANFIGTSYYALKDLLNIIENNVRLLDIDSISFDPKKENTNLKITAYYIKN